MATHDYVIANASGAAVRADLNNALAAIVSNNSSSTEPATTYAYMWWVDTANGQLKQRNAANDGWVTVRELDGTLLMEDGTAASPGLSFASDLDTGLFRAGTNAIGIATNGVERVEFGTSEVVFNDGGNDIDFRIEGDTDSALFFVDAGADLVGIGTTSPGTILDIRETATGATTAVSLFNTDNTDSTSQTARIGLSPDSRGAALAGLEVYKENADFSTSAARDVSLAFNVLLNNAKTEAARIDSSGRLLVGTSTSIAVGGATASNIQLAGSVAFQSQSRWVAAGSGPAFVLGKSRSATPGSYTIVQNDDDLGSIFFAGDDGTDLASIGARIACQVDGTPGADDMPGRLVFFTTADGASSPTERMRIDSSGEILFGKTTQDNTTNGVRVANLDSNTCVLVSTNTEATDTSPPLVINRQSSDGRLVQFRQGNTIEGTISVSGTTVTYGGGHLARWSQLPNNEDPSNILKGTVMSNLDEMCEWGDEDNEQLNKTKISEVEGDKNVAGVFVATSFDEDGLKDFFVAMTGDMVIRIAQGVTVERGDLLMSAGDGTAKPQDDDIIRSKTIAKVTSTNVSCTYDDGSYCVPCVLMAC